MYNPHFWRRSTHSEDSVVPCDMVLMKGMVCRCTIIRYSWWHAHFVFHVSFYFLRNLRFCFLCVLGNPRQYCMSKIWHCVTGLYYDTQEIVPCVKGDYRVNKANVELSRFSGKEIEVRALIEGQFLAKRAYAEDLGFTLSKQSVFGL